MKPVCQSIVLVFAFLAACHAQNQSNPPASEEKYLPGLRIMETNFFSNKPETAYRFSNAQLALMARTKLETNRVVVYVERRWTLERLRAYCVPTNVFPEGSQNLVAYNCPVETEVYKGRSAGFGRIWVYVGEDDGHNTYFGEAGTRWHRWTYSLNVERGANHWVIIEELPNDFMDSPKYDFSEPQGGANGRQPVLPDTNRTSAAAAYRRSP